MAKTNYVNKVEDAISIDLETGGLDSLKNGIRSIALYVNDEEYYYVILKPVKGLRYDSISEDITGITLEKMEAEGITETEAYASVKNFVLERTDGEKKPFMAGQNLSFDLRFLDAMFDRNSRFVTFTELVDHHYADSMHMKMTLSMLNIYKGPIKLEESYEYLTGKVHDAHNALEDARAAKEEIAAMRDYAKKEKWSTKINL